MSERWLQWAQRLEAVAQSGLHFSESEFDHERYQQIMQVATEMMAAGSGADVTAVQGLFNTQSGYSTPKFDVRGVVFRGDQLLLVREDLDAGRWTLPGGWADVGDTPSRAVEREIREEAGYQARAVRLLALYDRTAQGHPPYLFAAYKGFFLCALTDERQNLLPNVETSETGWFSEEALAGLDLSIGRVTLRQLRRMFEHHRSPDLPTDFD